MKGKPIEPGCLAMIVGVVTCPENNGRVVRVIGSATGLSTDALTPPEAFSRARELRIRMTDPPCFSPNDKRWWVEGVNGALGWSTVSGRVHVKVKVRAFKEIHLIRIDDGDTTEPRVTETHKPKTEEVF